MLDTRPSKGTPHLRRNGGGGRHAHTVVNANDVLQLASDAAGGCSRGCCGIHCTSGQYVQVLGGVHKAHSGRAAGAARCRRRPVKLQAAYSQVLSRLVNTYISTLKRLADTINTYLKSIVGTMIRGMEGPLLASILPLPTYLHTR